MAIEQFTRKSDSTTVGVATEQVFIIGDVSGTAVINYTEINGALATHKATLEAAPHSLTFGTLTNHLDTMHVNKAAVRQVYENTEGVTTVEGVTGETVFVTETVSQAIVELS